MAISSSVISAAAAAGAINPITAKLISEGINTKKTSTTVTSKMGKKLKPVNIGGIEFDALLDETKSLNSTVPAYNVESGYSVSDTIINEPLQISMTLFVTNTPVSFKKKHGVGGDRVNDVCEELENLWAKKKLVKIVTTNAIYKDMAITSISIQHSNSMGYSREVAITAQKVIKTKKKTSKIPSSILKSGKTKSKAGSATTSTSSKKSTSSSSSSSSSKSSSSSSSSSSSKKAKSKSNNSVLYNMLN